MPGKRAGPSEPAAYSRPPRGGWLGAWCTRVPLGWGSGGQRGWPWTRPTQTRRQADTIPGSDGEQRRAEDATAGGPGRGQPGKCTPAGTQTPRMAP